MCDALMELMKDDLDAKKAEGEMRANNLYAKLLKDGRTEAALRATEDSDYRCKLFEEFGL